MVTFNYTNDTNNTDIINQISLNDLDHYWHNLVQIYISNMYGRDNLINFQNDFKTLCQWWTTDSPLGRDILPHSPIALMLVLDGGYVISNEIRLLLNDWKNRMHNDCMCMECHIINFFQLCGFNYKQSMICAFHSTLYNIPVYSVKTAWDSLELLVDMIKPLNNDPIETNNFKIHITFMLEEYHNSIYNMY